MRYYFFLQVIMVLNMVHLAQDLIMALFHIMVLQDHRTGHMDIIQDPRLMGMVTVVLHIQCPIKDLRVPEHITDHIIQVEHQVLQIPKEFKG